MPFVPASDVLSTYTVLDLTRVRSGPTCVRQLADWGANVIKIEDPESAKSEGMGGPRGGPDFQNLHRNKRSMMLDLKDPKGLEIFMKLAAKADVIVENYRPDVKSRLKIDYASVNKINPRIIYGSISGFGQDGPYRDRPGFDQIAQGMGGLMSVTGEPGRGPMRVGIPIADLSAGLFCAMGILLALLEREKSGQGQWVQTSLLQAQVFMLDFQAARWTMAGEVPGQAGNDHPTSIPTGVFETKDGHINIACSGQAMWQRLKELMGDKGFDNPDFDKPAGRSKHRLAVNALINKYTRTDTAAAWIAKLNKAGIPCGEINNIDQVFANPQVQHLGIATDMPSHERGPTKALAQPIHMSRSKSRLKTPPPRIGEHTAEILAELGYTKKDVDALLQGAAGGAPLIEPTSAARSVTAAKAKTAAPKASATKTAKPAKAKS
jgi:crotonobetainyl-CoA:carnitine CoA-transferase CaiB-like acyl-CoA transferase